MSANPTTIIVLYTEDRENFPIKHALVVVKQLFQYGVREITVKDEKIFINLSYSPKAITLKRKFGNLPVRYMRTKIENNKEFKILGKVVRRYKFNLLDEEDESHRLMLAGPSGTKRKLTLGLDGSSGSDDDTELPPEHKQSLV